MLQHPLSASAPRLVFDGQPLKITAPASQPSPTKKKEDTAVHELGLLLKRIMHAESGEQSLTAPAPSLAPTDWTTAKIAAEVALKYGNHAEAEAAWMQALEFSSAFNYKDPRLAYTLDSIANFYLNEGKLGLAEEYCKRALQATEIVYDFHHIKVALCLNTLAGIYYSQRRFEEAESLSVRMLTIYHKIFGPDHADVGMASNNLAMVYHAQGKVELAEMMYERAMPIRKRALGKDHPDYKALVENYANLLNATEQRKKAEAVRATTRTFDGWHIFECHIPVSN